MFNNNNHIISHNINIQSHMSLGHMHARHIWEVGYPPIMHLLHMKHYDHAIKQYGQEGLR